MPWSNQSGGGNSGGPWGGGNNGGGGGPWGQGPKRPNNGGPSGPSGGPPDLEDILRKGQDRLKNALPGGGGSNKFLFALAGAGLLLLVLFQSFYQIQPDENGVELLFGKPKPELSEEGLNFHFWPFERVEIVNISERQETIGDTGSTGLMLSGDQNIVDVKFAILYQVVDPAAYRFNVNAPDDALIRVAESAMREIVGRRPADDIFRDNREGIAEDVRTILQRTLDEYGTGIQVNAVTIEDAAPPAQVSDAFDEVQRAEQEEDQLIEQGNREANKKLGAARGEAAQIIEKATGYKNRIVQEAEGEAQRFLSVYNEYLKAPEVTRKRLFLETMEEVYGKASSKVIMDSNSNVVPYLPLPELGKRNQGAN